jgi:microsomal prostaglandin-E synthase 2
MFRFVRVLSSSVKIRSFKGRSFNSSIQRIVPLAITTGSLLLLATPSIASCENVSPRLVSELPADLDLRKCKVTLYQFESCPFCRKARAVLDFCNIPYDVVEVNPLTKSETKTFASDYKKVPILLIEDPKSGEIYQIRDSKIIVRAVINASPDSLVGNNNPRTRLPQPVSLNDETILDNETYKDLSIDEAWIKWNEAYLLQLVVVNIYGTLGESRETFDYLLTHKDFGWVAREASYWAGSIVMNQVARSRLKKFKHIQGKHRSAFFQACADMGSAAKEAGGFIGGARPSPADLNAYGVIRSLEGTKTLREAIQGDAGPEFKSWYENMNQAVGESKLRSKINATQRGGN